MPKTIVPAELMIDLRSRCKVVPIFMLVYLYLGAVTLAQERLNSARSLSTVS